MIYILSGILVMAAATVFTRAFPFLLFARRTPPPRLIRSAKLVPGAVMTILVFTSLPISVEVTSPEMWIPWASALLVAALHLLLRQPLISIFGGTAFYMVLLQLAG
jgi:branched-subunit amino acid transport protein AzlD